MVGSETSGSPGQRLDEWINRPESERLEFKRAGGSFSYNDLARYCCALANEGGGKLVLGVTDDMPRRVVGTRALDPPEKFLPLITRDLRIRVEAETIADPRGRVLVFHVPARPLGHPLSLSGAYLRSQLDLLQADLASAEGDVDALHRQYDEEASRHDTLMSVLARLGEFVESAACPLCGREYGSIEDVRRAIGQHLAGLPPQLRDLSERLEGMRKAIEEKRRASVSVAADLRALQSDEATAESQEGLLAQQVRQYREECLSLGLEVAGKDVAELAEELRRAVSQAGAAELESRAGELHRLMDFMGRRWLQPMSSSSWSPHSPAVRRLRR